MSAPDHPAPVLGAAAGFLLAGLALFLQELDLLSLRWSMVLPSIVITTGLVTLFAGAVGAHRSRGAR
ncbi:hypothetical protein [Pseudonocardia abyssalis]|uniref:Uncharacterized protein n=1 Tax=Pseudonocardia abyssalis TaxID=2792008 RepID=A0ABS6UNL2_9PSEU|nr:hypothetical protein [Pseudonocardia abyssalis]MBW0119266.1 hypothetical protein [Pseudonocardia abyssalis]MBW0133835.1 hypothetical protein [Pseudonocardia abyssalis]